MTACPSILVVEDNDSDFHLVRGALRHSWPGGIELRRATRLQEALELLQDDRFRLILLDLSLPDSFGLDTVIAVRDAAPGSAIVVVTGNNQADIALQAVNLGAQDYLEKHLINGDHLVRSLRYALDRR